MFAAYEFGMLICADTGEEFRSATRDERDLSFQLGRPGKPGVIAVTRDGAVLSPSGAPQGSTLCKVRP